MFKIVIRFDLSFFLQNSLKVLSCWKPNAYKEYSLELEFLYVSFLIPGESEKTWGVWRAVTSNFAAQLS